MIAALLLSSSVLLFAPRSLATTPQGPLPIVGGTDAATCQWPSTVALVSSGSTYCSGTLIHPQVVLTAAHCLHPANGWGTPTSIGFGEQGAAPELSAGVQSCALHPQYDHYAPLHSPEDAYDLAYCVLTQPVVDVAPTPPLMGCEVDQLGPGNVVQLVGFGASFIDVDGAGEVILDGIGTKRHVAQTVEQIDDLDQIYLVGMGGSGDSGGSAYFQLDDGSWRVIAAAARIHPDAPPSPPYCTYGVIYTGIWNEMDWFESDSGFDLTPCHDADGTWNPGPDCIDFPLEPEAPASWVDGCGAQALAGAGLSCAPEPSGTTGDSGDSSDSTDSTGQNETGDPDDTGPTNGTDPTNGTTSDTGSGGATGPGPGEDTGLPGGTGNSSGEPSAEGNDEAGGCGCRSSSGPGRWGPAGLALLLAGWRRRTLDPRPVGRDLE